MPTTQETIQKVSEFADLAEGWHFGEGVAPSQGRIGQAIGFLEYASFCGLERANAFPGVRGQVEVTFYNGDRMLEITIETDNSITIAEDRENEQLSFEENLSTSDAYQRLEEFSQNIWVSSGHFIVNTTIRNVKVAGSLVSPWIFAAASQSPLLIWNAHVTQAVQYAHILLRTTTNRPATLGFIGQSGTLMFPTTVGSKLNELSLGTIAIGTSTIGAGTPHAEPLSV
jgi:hypothetical protein